MVDSASLADKQISLLSFFLRKFPIETEATDPGER